MNRYNGFELPQGVDITKNGATMSADEIVNTLEQLEQSLEESRGGEAIGEVAPMLHMNWETNERKSVALVDPDLPPGTKVYAQPGAALAHKWREFGSVLRTGRSPMSNLSEASDQILRAMAERNFPAFVVTSEGVKPVDDSQELRDRAAYLKDLVRRIHDELQYGDIVRWDNGAQCWRDMEAEVSGDSCEDSMPLATSLQRVRVAADEPDGAFGQELAIREVAEPFINARHNDITGIMGIGKVAEFGRALLKAARAQSDGGEAEAVELQWRDGEPPKIYRSEWFIAETIHGDRAVLQELPEENSYDYTTKDGTYCKNWVIKRWMQFPDSEFYPPDDIHPPAANQGVPEKLAALIREAEQACQDDGEQTLRESQIAQRWLDSLNEAANMVTHPSAANQGVPEDVLAQVEKLRQIPEWDRMPYGIHAELDVLFKMLANPPQQQEGE